MYPKATPGFFLLKCSSCKGREDNTRYNPCSAHFNGVCKRRSICGRETQAFQTISCLGDPSPPQTKKHVESFFMGQSAPQKMWFSYCNANTTTTNFCGGPTRSSQRHAETGAEFQELQLCAPRLKLRQLHQDIPAEGILRPRNHFGGCLTNMGPGLRHNCCHSEFSRGSKESEILPCGGHLASFPREMTVETPVTGLWFHGKPSGLSLSLEIFRLEKGMELICLRLHFEAIPLVRHIIAIIITINMIIKSIINSCLEVRCDVRPR